MTSVIGRRRGVKNWSKLLTDCTKKNCGYWGEGVKNLEKLLTSFMDGPLISTQQTVVEKDFNAKQWPESLHLTVENLEYNVIASKPGLSNPNVWPYDTGQ